MVKACVCTAGANTIVFVKQIPRVFFSFVCLSVLLQNQYKRGLLNGNNTFRKKYPNGKKYIKNQVSQLAFNSKICTDFFILLLLSGSVGVCVCFLFILSLPKLEKRITYEGKHTRNVNVFH